MSIRAGRSWCFHSKISAMRSHLAGSETAASTCCHWRCRSGGTSQWSTRRGSTTCSKTPEFPTRPVDSLVRGGCGRSSWVTSGDTGTGTASGTGGSWDWDGDVRPTVAETYFQLGDYQKVITILRDFQPTGFSRRGFDPRWILLPRVRLLRGQAHRANRPERATASPSLPEHPNAADPITFPPGVDGIVAGGFLVRGKSELHWVDCQVTPGRRKATDRATENKPPLGFRPRW